MMQGERAAGLQNGCNEEDCPQNWLTASAPEQLLPAASAWEVEEGQKPVYFKRM